MALPVVSNAPPQGDFSSALDAELARKMLEAVPDALVAVDHDGNIELVNVQVERLFGYPRAEMLRNKIEMLLPGWYAGLQHGGRSGVEVDSEVTVQDIGLPLAGRRKDGTEFPIDISFSPIESAKGSLVVAAIRDSSARRRAEDERRKVDEAFRQLIEASRDGMVIFGPDGRIEQANTAAEVQFGYGRKEMLHHPLEMLLPDRFGDVVVAHRTAYLAQPTTRQLGDGLELAGRRKDGSEFPIDISLSPLETPEGRFGVARVRDITEQLRLQRELNEKAALIDLAHDAIVVLDPMDGRIRYWNRGAEALYGYTAVEATGQVSDELLKRVATATFSEMVAKAAQSDHWDGRLQHTTKDGDVLVVESRWAVLRDRAGSASGVLEINRDVTEVVRASEALREANQSLEAHVQERTADLESFSYSVSHDLRTPLRALNGFVAILAEEASGQLSEPALDAMAEITGNSIRMGRLIDDLLAFARLGSQGLVKRKVDMDSLARHAAGALSSFMDGRTIKLEIEAMATCYGDPALLEQVWSNLLANAIKFTAGRSPAHITAGAKTQKGQVVYFVRDNGVGFDMAYAGKLFGVFQRLHAADEFEGNGVGLANVLRICGRHGGTAWAEAVLDQGATFYFTVGGGRP